MSKYKSTTAALLLCTAVSVQAQASDELDKIQREVGIMEKILTAALKQDTDNKVRNVSSSYLQHQGVVFSFDVRGGSRWSTVFASVPDAPLPPMPDIDFEELTEIEVLGEHVQVISDAVVVKTQEAYQQAMEVMRESAERVREVAEQERDVSREIRDLEREKRDLEFDRRHDKDAKEQELEKRKQALQASIKELEKEQQKLSLKQQEMRKELAEKKQARVKEQQQQWAALAKQVDKSLSLTLCDYGSGLRSLPNDEHVSFIIRGVSEGKGELVKVFKKSDIKKCVVGDIKAAQLIDKASSYRF
jgi:DNA repair exonuclease SbcCD ATPase subunit